MNWIGLVASEYFSGVILFLLPVGFMRHSNIFISDRVAKVSKLINLPARISAPKTHQMKLLTLLARLLN